MALSDSFLILSPMSLKNFFVSLPNLSNPSFIYYENFFQPSFIEIGVVYVYLMAKYLISYLMIKAYRYEVIKSESIKNLYKALYIRKIINYLIIFH